MAEHQDPETPPEPSCLASVVCFEQMYSMIAAGSIKAMTDHMDTHKITPESFRSLVENRYYPSLRYSPVATAARTGQLDIMKTLIVHGFSPEEPSRNMTGKNEYPIHLACAANQIAVVRSLIEDYGVSVDARDSGDTTPIFWAILTENMEMLKVLVEAGANVNNTFHDTMTPLLFAAFMINSSMCRYLMDHGANVNETGDCGNTPLCLSLRDVTTSSVLLDAGADIDHVNNQGDTPFILASKRNYRHSLELLAQRGADANIKDSAGQTPLHHTIAREYISLASHLVINLNVDVEERDCAGRTPFHMAFYMRNISLVELLLEAGADPGRETIVYDDDPSDKLIPDWFEVVHKCRRIGRNPRSLAHLSRVTVRYILGKDLHTVVSALPVPEMVKEDLTLKHVENKFTLNTNT